MGGGAIALRLRQEGIEERAKSDSHTAAPNGSSGERRREEMEAVQEKL